MIRQEAAPASTSESCRREEMSSLRNERPRCVSTVFSVTNSVWAICRLVPPLAASSTTRRSLGVSEVSPGAVGAARPRADRGELAPLGAPGPRSRNGRPALTPRTEAPGPRCVVRRRARLHRGQWVRVRASSSPDSATAGMYESIVGDASGHAMFGGRCQGVCLMCDASVERRMVVAQPLPRGPHG